MKSPRKMKEKAKQILKQLDDNPGLFRIIQIPRDDFEAVRDYLGEHTSRTEFKYYDTVIKLLG